DPGQSLTIAPKDEPVRVLLVFADPPHARPLAARLERERLRDLFFAEILPKRNVEVDMLCHGVTRARLQETITQKNGYHVVHWSGHGQVDRLNRSGKDPAGRARGRSRDRAPWSRLPASTRCGTHARCRAWPCNGRGC